MFELCIESYLKPTHHQIVPVWVFYNFQEKMRIVLTCNFQKANSKANVYFPYFPRIAIQGNKNEEQRKWQEKKESQLETTRDDWS